jgi:hypothetical protein
MRFLELQTGKCLVGCSAKLRLELTLVRLQHMHILYKGLTKNITPAHAEDFVLKGEENLYWNYQQPHARQWYKEPLDSLQSAIRTLDQLNGFKAKYIIVVAGYPREAEA